MPKTVRGPAGATTNQPPAVDPIDPIDDDDEREGASDVETQAARDPGDSAAQRLEENRLADEFFEAAKRKLGLPAHASPLDMLRHIVGSPTVRPAGPPRAACSLVLVVDGKRVVLAAGDLIPEGVDLGEIHPHAITRGR